MAEQLAGSVALEAVPPIPKKACVLCSSLIDATAKFCNTCKAYQDGKTCGSCGRWIPRDAQQCPECKTFQDLRRFATGDALVLSLLISLISVISAVGPAILNLINLRSKTAGFLISSEIDQAINRDKRVLVVRVMNSGGRASVVNEASLDLTAVAGGVVPLDIMNARDRQVRASGQTDLKLFGDDSAFAIARRQAPVVIAALCTAKVSLTVTVGEQNLVGSTYEAPHRIPVSGRSVRLFVADRLMGKDPEDCK
jgi:RNA polymerase subunit RPABC4/transcription elongation factor Spt4